MKYFLAAILLFFSIVLNAQLKSPEGILHDYGSHVSYYHQLESYFTYLTQNSDMIKPQPYGQTYEGRGLNAYIISTPENLKNIDAIRNGHLNAAGLGGSGAAPDKIIVWLSFNVHGNEPAAAESAMNVAYELLNPDNADTKEWLQNVVIILAPCLNPDGYSRYGNWLHTVTGKELHPGRTDREHMEPWPGGRENHYQYDLNRDWAWQVQAETQQRMVLYNQWMPMVHADVHEMGYNDPYFFPPPAEPMHDFITKGQKDFYEAIGQMASKKFDKNGWGYYTREIFDLFYPSYGDTYPCFNGAVGMTFEQGGIGAGRAVELDNGKVLTLQDRIDHHTAAMLTVVETAAWKKDMLIRNFRNYFKESREKPKGKYKTYVIKSSGKSPELAQLLTRNKIAFAYADETKKTEGYHYQTDREDDFTIELNDIIVSADQPKAVLTQVLFEPVQRLSDSLSYDITAWDIPHAYGGDGYALKRDLNIKTRTQPKFKGKFENEGVYAYYIPWNGRGSVRVLSQLHGSKIKVRSARKESLFRGIKVHMGDLIVLKGDNPHLTAFEQTMSVMLDGKPDYEVIESGYSLSGGDLGGEGYPLLKAPDVLLLSGSGVNSTDFGQVWFYMDEIAGYPVSIVDVQNIGRVAFGDFNTIILANGYYSLSDADKGRIDTFINNGGKVIAQGNAMDIFEDRAGYSLKHFATESDEAADQQRDADEALDARYYNYDSFVRRELSSSVSGAIIENRLDKTHPLSYGLGNGYYSLKTSASHYQLLKDAFNVIYVPKDYKSFGFIGSSLKRKLGNTVTFAVEPKGEGQVIYMVDNPLFRGFWENGNLLFSNALFQVN
ncbi:M14 family zinc carboxypeptidase [Flavobacterium psychrotrophum]|uniref:M14 family zinc carboxypeptidase n=1 Tax=Flavobacterium psychrotrophum TaxID=2294119 RepID=UPI000E31E9E5|nr:M14 family zinc carboxypeptidase [Flavobacterium psychrotrophum]